MTVQPTSQYKTIKTWYWVDATDSRGEVHRSGPFARRKRAEWSAADLCGVGFVIDGSQCAIVKVEIIAEGS